MATLVYIKEIPPAMVFLSLWKVLRPVLLFSASARTSNSKLLSVYRCESKSIEILSH